MQGAGNRKGKRERPRKSRGRPDRQQVLGQLMVRLNVVLAVVEPEVPVTGTVAAGVPDAVVTVTYSVPL